MFVASFADMFTDTHTHLYLDAFDIDRYSVISRAMEAGVKRMLLPNIDESTSNLVFKLTRSYPGICLPMMGLHPTSVRSDFRKALHAIGTLLDHPEVIAVGEIGIDLYWDQTYIHEQEEAFREQIGWAKERGLPVVIHARDSFREIFRVLDQEWTDDLKGVFHSFSGSEEELERALSYGFMIGINGIVTFKNSDLDRLVPRIPLDQLLLETDAPYLAPVPFRGTRNESSYLVQIASKVAEIDNLTLEEIATATTRNAEALFKLDPLDEF
jgi:TatD DNase family protein